MGYSAFFATALFGDIRNNGQICPNPRFFSFLQAYIESMSEDKFNLMQYCYDGNLVVAPKRGKAILWYNHFVDEETGWMGEMDEYALHGGCGLWSGVKWIANNWITSADARWAHYKSDHDV